MAAWVSRRPVNVGSPACACYDDRNTSLVGILSIIEQFVRGSMSRNDIYLYLDIKSLEDLDGVLHDRHVTSTAHNYTHFTHDCFYY